MCCVTLSSSIVNNFFCNKLCYWFKRELLRESFSEIVCLITSTCFSQVFIILSSLKLWVEYFLCLSWNKYEIEFQNGLEDFVGKGRNLRVSFFFGKTYRHNFTATQLCWSTWHKMIERIRKLKESQTVRQESLIGKLALISENFGILRKNIGNVQQLPSRCSRSSQIVFSEEHLRNRD